MSIVERPHQTDATTRWVEVFDQLDAELDATLGSLERGIPSTLRLFVPPADLPPLPVALRERATSILERQRAVAKAVRERLDVISSNIAERTPRQGASVAPSSAARFETRA
ncbi:MAG: hypothetical protein AAGG08_08975 [Actinomycetota bacterium]